MQSYVIAWLVAGLTWLLTQWAVGQLPWEWSLWVRQLALLACTTLVYVAGLLRTRWCGAAFAFVCLIFAGTREEEPVLLLLMSFMVALTGVYFGCGAVQTLDRQAERADNKFLTFTWAVAALFLFQLLCMRGTSGLACVVVMLNQSLAVLAWLALRLLTPWRGMRMALTLLASGGLAVWSSSVLPELFP